MARPDLSRSDYSSKVASELEYVIRTDKHGANPKVKKVSAEEAMKDKRVMHASSKRDVTRVLFISQNTELINPAKQTLDGYINISDLFDEVHILLLRPGIAPKSPILRVSDNVWVYTATAKYWWRTPQAGIDMAEEQLEFAVGFRPDLIVARDPFESATVALKLSEKYKKPAQLHIVDDYTSKEFVKESHYSVWRRQLPQFNVANFKSVRTQTDEIKKMINRKFPAIEDVETLPRFHSYEYLVESKARIDLKEKYKPVVFTMLYIGDLDYESNLHHILDSARFVLTNPRVGLVVVGDGKMRHDFEKRAKALNIHKQVIFETMVVEDSPFLKSANMLLIPDTDFESEEMVLKGAAAGIPMIMASTEKRRDLFVHDESAGICKQGDLQGYTNEINKLLNNFDLRIGMAKKAQKMITEKFHHDEDVYRETYRNSIEQAFFVE